MSMPKLSIITVNLNNATGLRKTIESVINQTFIDYEYIVIDGGSTVESVDVIKEFEDKITYWISEPDKGIYYAMNKGILKATGEYLLFLNSGDWLTEEAILSKVFEIPRKANIIYGHMYFISDKGSTLRSATDEKQLSLAYFFNNSFCHPATFISRKLFNNSLFDESLKIAADKKFFIEKILLQNCSLQKTDEIITNFDMNGITYKPEYNDLIKEENNKIFTQFVPPRMLKDLDLYRNNYTDIHSMVKIKKYKILYFAFEGLKKTATLFQKYLRF
jgi:glycosyltransferase involved in cell wall biosynthesis